MTNFDRIKAMSVEEMAEFICTIQEAPCHFCNYRKDGVSIAECLGGFDTNNCKKGVIERLESEVQEE